MPSLLHPSFLLSAALSALWQPPLCSGLRVSLSFETSRRIAALQDFASVGGQVVTDLSISLKSCITNTTETEAMCTWDGANQLFLILLSSQQLENLTRSISRNELSDTFECEQPSMVPASPAPPAKAALPSRSLSLICSPPLPPPLISLVCRLALRSACSVGKKRKSGLLTDIAHTCLTGATPWRVRKWASLSLDMI